MIITYKYKAYYFEKNKRLYPKKTYKYTIISADFNYI